MTNEQKQQDLAILKGAKAVLEGSPRLGKKHYARKTPDGVCYCLMGAIGKASPLEMRPYSEEGDDIDNCFLYSKDEDRFAEYLGFVDSMGYSDICAAYRWNDTHERTKEEVIARIDAAIERLEKQS